MKLPVSGSGEWKLVDDESSAIEVHKPSTNLSGAVEITHGTLKVVESFDTTGNLIFKSVSGSEPAIEISAGKKAEFGI